MRWSCPTRNLHFDGLATGDNPARYIVATTLDDVMASEKSTSSQYIRVPRRSLATSNDDDQNAPYERPDRKGLRRW